MNRFISLCVCVCAWGVCRGDSWRHNHNLFGIIRLLNSASFSRSVFLFGACDCLTGATFMK